MGCLFPSFVAYSDTPMLQNDDEQIEFLLRPLLFWGRRLRIGLHLEDFLKLLDLFDLSALELNLDVAGKPLFSEDQHGFFNELEAFI